MTESSHMVGIRGSFDPVLIPFSSFSPFSILGGPIAFASKHGLLSLIGRGERSEFSSKS